MRQQGGNRKGEQTWLFYSWEGAAFALGPSPGYDICAAQFLTSSPAVVQNS